MEWRKAKEVYSIGRILKVNSMRTSLKTQKTAQNILWGQQAGLCRSCLTKYILLASRKYLHSWGCLITTCAANICKGDANQCRFILDSYYQLWNQRIIALHSFGLWTVGCQQERLIVPLSHFAFDLCIDPTCSSKQSNIFFFSQVHSTDNNGCRK